MYDIPLSFLFFFFWFFCIIQSVDPPIFFFFWIGYEILKFTLKSELVSKSETINKSLWSLTVGEVSSEVNSYSTHLPVVAVWATQGRNCFWVPCLQTHACMHTQTSRQTHTSTIFAVKTVEASNCCFSQYVHREKKKVVMYSFKTTHTECKVAESESICHSDASSWKSPLCFQAIRGITHLYETAICEAVFCFLFSFCFFFLLTSTHHPLPSTVIMCSHKISG